MILILVESLTIREICKLDICGANAHCLISNYLPKAWGLHTPVELGMTYVNPLPVTSVKFQQTKGVGIKHLLSGVLPYQR